VNQKQPVGLSAPKFGIDWLPYVWV